MKWFTASRTLCISSAREPAMARLRKPLGRSWARWVRAWAPASRSSSRTSVLRPTAHAPRYGGGWDLSANAPSDAAGQAKIIGEARWLRITIVRVRPGRNVEFETAAKAVKAANEKANPNVAFLV